MRVLNADVVRNDLLGVEHSDGHGFDPQLVRHVFVKAGQPCAAAGQHQLRYRIGFAGLRLL